MLFSHALNFQLEFRSLRSGTEVRLSESRKPGASLKLGDVVPDFSADTTTGRVDFHDWLGGSWAMLFSHPADFTPVCTTEIGCVEEINDRFAQRGVSREN